MAQFYSDVDSSRESTVFIQAEKEGYLDKKSTGVIRTKTSKRWCSVQGSIFYQTKSNQGTGEIEIIEMSDMQFVRKISADTTGTQFEIVKKKTHHIFVCASREECNAWVKALQSAMVIRDSHFHKNPQPRDSFVQITRGNHSGSIKSQSQSTSSEDGHQSPTYENANKYQMTTSPKKEEENGQIVRDEYSLPKDALDSGGTEGKHPDENGYSVVHMEGGRPSYDSTPSKNTKHPLSSPQPDKQQSSSPQSKSIPEKKKIHGKDNESCSSETLETSAESSSAEISNRFVKEGQDPNSVNPPMSPVEKLRTQNQSSSGDSEETDVKTVVESQSSSNGSEETAVKTVAESENESNDDLLNYLFTALDDRLSPVKELEHVLTAKDKEPLRELKTFLRNNEIQCRTSIRHSHPTEEPINACRSFLTNIDNMM